MREMPYFMIVESAESVRSAISIALRKLPAWMLRRELAPRAGDYRRDTRLR